MARPSDDTSARPLLEVLLGFVGALLVIPLLFRLVSGFFRSGLLRRLLTDAVLVGATTLLTRDDVLDRVFGRKGEGGTALLKSDPER
jgi:hypothetical protein